MVDADLAKSEKNHRLLAPLSRLRGLRNLGLSTNRAADATALAELWSLRRLDPSGNALTDVSALGELTRLVWLRLPLLRWLWLDAGTLWADPVRPRSGPDAAPALRVERMHVQGGRPGVN